jgi:hypothetical protein
MAAEDEELFALRKTDRDALLPLLTLAGTDGGLRQAGFNPGLLWFKTQSTITANGSANCIWQEPTAGGWADTSIEYLLYNRHPTAAVGSGKIVGAIRSAGRWCIIVEMC